jgi:hypothetical protein
MRLKRKTVPSCSTTRGRRCLSRLSSRMQASFNERGAVMRMKPCVASRASMCRSESRTRCDLPAACIVT